MPHKRKGKGGFQPGLQFQPEESWLYLGVWGEGEGWLEVPLHTLVLLFTIRHTEASAQVRLVQEEPRRGEVGVRVRREEVQEEVEVEVPAEVRCCRPPVWYLPRQRTCIAGLCSVAR